MRPPFYVYIIARKQYACQAYCFIQYKYLIFCCSAIIIELELIKRAERGNFYDGETAKRI